MPSRPRVLLSRAILLGGVALGVAHLAPSLPREHTVDMVFDAAQSERITSVSLDWREADALTARGGVTLHFEPGAAPDKLRQKIFAPNGDYVLHLIVQQSEPSAPSVEINRRVRLDGQTTRLLLEGELK